MKKISKLFLIIIINLLFICIAGFTAVPQNNDKVIKNNFKLSNFISDDEYNQFVNYYNNPYLQILFNLNNEPEYLLVTAEGQGYAVFNRYSGKLLEMSKIKESPYKNIASGYYLAPFSYAKGTVNNLIDIESGAAYTVKEKESFKNLQRRLMQRNINENFSKLNAINASENEFDFDKTIYCVDALDADAYTNVDYSNSIMKWHNSDEDFLRNRDGTCTQVALTLLYRYADIVFGGIIPQLPPQAWINACSNNSLLIQGAQKDYSLVGTNNAHNTMSNFTRYLIKLSGITSYGTSDNQMIQALNSYNSEINGKGCLNITTVTQTQNSSQNIKQFVSSGIANNKPTAVSIYSNKGSQVDLHKVLVYGIRNEEQSTIYRVHSGWDQKSSYYISDDYLVFGENSIAAQLNVLSGTNHILDYSGVSHSCNNSSCYANQVDHRYYEDNTIHACVCGKTESHNYDPQRFVPHYDGVHVCDECGAFEKHEMQNINNSVHYCNICSYTEPHNWSQINDRHICLDLCGATGDCETNNWTHKDSNNKTLFASHKGACEICKNTIYAKHTGCTSSGMLGHSIDCSECGLNVYFAKHQYSYESIDANTHRTKCYLCGYIKGTSSHNFETHLLFFLKCKGCGYVKLKTA